MNDQENTPSAPTPKPWRMTNADHRRLLDFGVTAPPGLTPFKDATEAAVALGIVPHPDQHGEGKCAAVDSANPGKHVVKPMHCWLSNRSDAVPHPPHLHGVHPSISTAAFWCDGGAQGINPFEHLGIAIPFPPRADEPAKFDRPFILGDEDRAKLRATALATMDDLSFARVVTAVEEIAEGWALHRASAAE